jgi:hypothetical protein
VVQASGSDRLASSFYVGRDMFVPNGLVPDDGDKRRGSHDEQAPSERNPAIREDDGKYE